MSGVEQVARAEIVRAVTLAANSEIHNARWRRELIAYARTADRFAAGAWNIDGCRCPASGVGLDRLEPSVRRFAGQFDMHMDVDTLDGDTYIFEVVD